MDEFTAGSGKRESCMATASTFGQTERPMRVSSTQTKNMAMASTPGQTEDFTKAIGEMASSMALLSIASKLVLIVFKVGMGSGSLASVKSGLMSTKDKIFSNS